MLYYRGDTGVAAGLLALYIFSHWCMAVIMFKEIDQRDAGPAKFKYVKKFLKRLADVFFLDIQLAAAAIHGNRMIEGMTQLMMKASGQSRVAKKTIPRVLYVI